LLFGNWFSISGGSLHVPFECKYFSMCHEDPSLHKIGLCRITIIFVTVYCYTEMQVKR